MSYGGERATNDQIGAEAEQGGGVTTSVKVLLYINILLHTRICVCVCALGEGGVIVGGREPHEGPNRAEAGNKEQDTTRGVITPSN